MMNNVYYKCVICQEKACVGSSKEKSWRKLAHLYVLIVSNGFVWVSRLKASEMLCHFSQDGATSNFRQLHCENREPCIFWVCKNLFLDSPWCKQKELLIDIPISSTCFGLFFAHPQERKTVFYSMWYNAPKLLPVGGRVCNRRNRLRGCLDM